MDKAQARSLPIDLMTGPWILGYMQHFPTLGGLAHPRL